jgi:NAD(P)-dependent dehydrogenase (short-subunit alcohol dehydrogenase family)
LHQPGWIVTTREDAKKLRRKDHLQHPTGRVGRPANVAAMVAYLLDSERAASSPARISSWTAA